MLVLTRKSGESLRIGHNIIVSVLDNVSGQVKLGIEAPREIPVYREEIYNRIQEENRAAVLTDSVKPHLLQRFLKGMK